jgi:uncharacterized membrane protein YhhN
MTEVSGRIILLFAVITGLSYAGADAFSVSDPVRIVWKGASMGLLAAFAAANARSVDGWLLVAVLAASAASDVLLLTVGTTAGGLAFIVADLIAIYVYVRNRRTTSGGFQSGLAFAIVPVVAFLAYSLPADRAEALPIAIFVVPLATMAVCAWLSRFPRALTGLGATLVLLSDLLIFARMGPLTGIPPLSAVVWLLYFAGEVLVCVGIVFALRRPKLIGSEPSI